MDIRNYLKTETLEELTDGNYSKHDKLAIAFFELERTKPETRLRCSQVAPLLGLDPKYSRGIVPMVQAIHRQMPDFPIHILETNKKGKLDIENVQAFREKTEEESQE